jgi:hypothetical protein
MKTVLRIALATLAIVGVIGVEGQTMTAPAALAEFGVPGHWAAPSCDRLLVVLTFESSPTSRFVVRRDKDGMRVDIMSATKLQNDLATLGPFDSAPRGAPFPPPPRP